MFFQSDRPIEGSQAKDWDIWVSEATSSTWGEPRNLGAAINSPAVETFPVATANGTLYFSSDRPGSDNGDIYRARFVGGAYAEPEQLPAPLNTAKFDSNAYFAADERLVILSSTRGSEHRGSGDLFISFRKPKAARRLVISARSTRPPEISLRASHQTDVISSLPATDPIPIKAPSV